MNSRTITYIIALAVVGTGLCGSHFQLVKDSERVIWQEVVSKARPMEKAFFQCDKEARCTYVIQRNETQEYTVAYGEVSTGDIEDMSTVWKKMVVNILPGMNDSFIIFIQIAYLNIYKVLVGISRNALPTSSKLSTMSCFKFCSLSMQTILLNT